jgi:hypothetical protein
MWRRVDIVLTDVSGERTISIFRIKEIRERGTSVSSFVSFVKTNLCQCCLWRENPMTYNRVKQ